MTLKPTPEPARHPFGPRPIGALLPRITRTAFRSKGAAAARLTADWAEIVGPGLAAATAPKRLSGGVLTINCNGPMAMELQHCSDEIMQRINAQLGFATVKKLRFAQEGGLASPVSRRQSAPPPPPIEIADMPDGPLREALAALGAHVKQR